MKIEDLIKEVYEDLNGQITSVESSDDVIVYFECDDWNEENLTRKFKITCYGVKENAVVKSFVERIDFTDSDPILWNHNEEHGYLYYTSEFENNYELLGRLWESHEKVYGGLRPLSEYINTYRSGEHIEFCRGSYGLLAQGPKSVLAVYEAAILHRIKTNFVPSYKPEGGYRALFFDNLYVICKSVSVQELSN